jgi:hypothetical protein
MAILTKSIKQESDVLDGHGEKILATTAGWEGHYSSFLPTVGFRDRR